MTAKQRVHATLRHERADRIPIFMWYHPETARRIGKELDIPAGAVAEVLGDDIRQTWVGNNAAMEGVAHEFDGETHSDFWGIEWVKSGPFNQIRRSPLQEADDESVHRYSYPYARVPDLMANMDRIVPWAGEFFIGCDISPCVFEMVCRIVGMEGAVFDLAARPERSAFMLAQAAEFSRRLAEEACRKFPLDWLWTGDDVAGQQSMIMNPAVWRRMVRPHLEEIVGVGKSHGLRVAYHCCGAVRPIIPDLVEMGVDVLNPVQHGCPGMDPGELKREFGSRMTFMGGIDTQDLLPHGTPGEVRRETSRLVETMTSDGGGYILAASHTVPPETPLENIFAMYEAAGVGRGEIYARAADVRTKERLRDLR